jgi:hypothetical protein
MSVELQSLLQTLEQLSKLEYTKETRPAFKLAVEQVKSTFKDFRAYMVSNCKVAELPHAFAEIVRRTRLIIQEQQDRQQKLIDAELARAEAKKLQAERDQLINEIWSQKDSFEEREWACLIELIQTGYIKKHQLKDYGVEI